MNIAIRYYTQTGNTRKLANAISEEIGVSAKDLTVPLDEKVDILFFCNSVYWASMNKEVKKYIQDNKDKIGCLVNVSSAAIIESTYAQVKKEAEACGVTVSDKEFHCRGKFTAFHPGKPDASDLEAVKKFAKEIVG